MHSIVLSLGAGVIGALLVVWLSPAVTTPGSPEPLSTSLFNGGAAVQALDVSDVVEQVNPAVVSILITEEVPIIEQYFEDPFEDFFGVGFG